MVEHASDQNQTHPYFQHDPQYPHPSHYQQYSQGPDQTIQYRPYTHAGTASQSSLPPLNYATIGQQMPPAAYQDADGQLVQTAMQTELSPGQLHMSPSNSMPASRSHSAAGYYAETPPTLHSTQFQSPPSIPSNLSASYGTQPVRLFQPGTLQTSLPNQAMLQSSSSPLAVSAHGLIKVLTAAPLMGSTSTTVNVSIAIAAHDAPHVIRGFRVLFGHHGTTTRVTGESKAAGAGERVDLAAYTPPITLATKYPNTAPTSVPLSLQALDENGNVADWADMGTFIYTGESAATGANVRVELMKFSDSPVHPSSATFRSSTKRPGSPLSSSRDSPTSGSRPVFQDVSSHYPPESSNRGLHRRGQHSRNSSLGSLVNGFGRMDHHSRNSSMTSLNSDAALSMASTSTSESTPGMGITLPLSPPGTADGSFGSGDKVLIQTEHGPRLVDRTPIGRMRAQNVSNLAPTPSSGTLRHPPLAPAQPDTPTLYRTSQLPNSVPSDDGEATVVGASRANLRFEGNLDYMAVGWSHEEWLAKRRLVQFWRRQEGQNIIASFRGVGLQDLTDDSIVISCIFREEKNECFVTSVDTIYLLEALVSVRFTVEEKNRIRRNMEGFKPITISKSKQENEAFFKLIMSFPVRTIAVSHTRTIADTWYTGSETTQH